MFRKIAVVAAAISMIGTPLAAEQARAEISRSSAPADGESELGGRNSLVFLLGIAAVAAAVVFLSEDNDSPVSV